MAGRRGETRQGGVREIGRGGAGGSGGRGRGAGAGRSLEFERIQPYGVAPCRSPPLPRQPQHVDARQRPQPSPHQKRKQGRLPGGRLLRRGRAGGPASRAPLVALARRPPRRGPVRPRRLRRAVR
jgi:hypothetical protein